MGIFNKQLKEKKEKKEKKVLNPDDFADQTEYLEAKRKAEENK